jgi:hypothetical protein
VLYEEYEDDRDGGDKTQVREQEGPNGFYEVVCNCWWAMKNPTGMCHHQSHVLREGWDAWDPQAGMARPIPELVIVPIFAHRQGKPRNFAKRRASLFAQLYVAKTSGLVRNVAVDSLVSDPAGEGVTAKPIGTIGPGEGRAVLREVVIDWLYTKDRFIRDFECPSLFHVRGEGLVRTESEPAFIRDGFTILTAGVCFTCLQDVGLPPDDL